MRSDLHEPLGTFGGIVDLERLIEVARHWLLDVEMLARKQRVEANAAVPVIRRGDNHRVDVLVLEETSVVRVDRGIG